MRLDSALHLRESRRRSMNRARAAEASIRRLVTKFGVPPSSARNLQQAIVQGTMLYPSELTWNGSKMEGEIQTAINWMGRAFLGVRRTTPSASSQRRAVSLRPELCLTTARRFALRLMARGRGPGGDLGAKGRTYGQGEGEGWIEEMRDSGEAELGQSEGFPGQGICGKKGRRPGDRSGMEGSDPDIVDGWV